MIPPHDTSTDDNVGDLLPALINGTLDAETAMQVRSHLDRCAACREELAEWEAIATATRAYTARQEITAPALDRLWAGIEPGTLGRPGNGALSHPAQARAAVRQGITDPSQNDPARQSWRTSMSTTTIPTSRPRFAFPAWTRHLHGISTALLIAVILALAVAAWGLSGIGGNGGGDEPNGNFAVVPGSPVAESTSVYLPEPLTVEDAPWIAAITAAECDAEPMSNHDYAEAKHTDPGPLERSYDIVGPADSADAEAAVAVLRAHQACTDAGMRAEDRSYYTSAGLFNLNVADANPDTWSDYKKTRMEIGRQWSAWANEQGIYPLVLITGVETESGVSPSNAHWEWRYNPDNSVMLADGRMMLFGQGAYWAEDPQIQEYGFAPDPNATLVAFILREVDGQWLIDEQDIPICFGDCDWKTAATPTVHTRD
jgi:hypothetical protein